MLVALGLLVTAGTGPVATAAPAGPDGRLGIQLLEAPVASQGDPRALIYIIDSLPPGTTIERRIQVSNQSGTARDVDLYPAAATIEDGGFRFADGRTDNDLTSWTTVTPDGDRLEADATLEATVRIAVPADATGGERYAVVWAETAGDPDAGEVQEVSRVGIRIYLSVSGEPAETDFEITGITGVRGSGGAPTVTATVTNTGDRAVDLSGTIGLSDGPGGVSVDPTATDAILTLAPGDTGTVTARFDPTLADGPWTAAVTLTSGTTERSASGQLSFTAVPDAAEVDGGVAWWWWAAGAAALALLVLLAAGLARRRSVAAA